MPRLTLGRALTYRYGGTLYRRGEIVTVDHEPTYHDMIRSGQFVDPDRQIDYIRPEQLRAVPQGSTIPILRDCGLGDVLMASIPIRDLVARYPGLRFRYVCDSRYVEALQWVARAIPRLAVGRIVDLRGFQPYAIDLRAWVERQREAWSVDRTDLFCRYLLGGPPSSYAFPFAIGEPERLLGSDLLRAAGAELGRPAVGLVLRASQPMRSWDLAYLIRFAQIASREGWTTVLLDPKPNPPPREPGEVLPPPPWAFSFEGLDHVVDLTGQVSVGQLAQVTAALDCVVSPDTGNVHLAEACRTRCVAYFTSVPPRLRVGHYRYVRAVYPEGQLPCLECGHSPRCKVPDPLGMRPCGELSTPELVWTQLEAIMDSEPGSWDPLAHRSAPRGHTGPRAREDLVCGCR